MKLHIICVMILAPSATYLRCFEDMVHVLYHMCSFTLFDVLLVSFLSVLDASLEELPLKYLPPLSLRFSLPCDYPSHSSPTYTLSCQWLQNNKVRSDLNIGFEDIKRIVTSEIHIHIFKPAK